MNDVPRMADSALAANAGVGAGVTLFGWQLGDIYSALGITILLIQFIYWLWSKRKKE